MGRVKDLAVYPGLVLRVFPVVRRELEGWTRLAGQIPDPMLRKEALASLSSKAFHCMGGSVLALENPRRPEDLIRAIVAIQTVSDYLDNLCDRAAGKSKWTRDGSLGATRDGFLTCMRLHEAFLCSTDPHRPEASHYESYPLVCPEGDGGYLQSLADASREMLGRLPSYRAALPAVRQLAQLYSELQSIKHLSPEIRDGLMEEWFRVRWKGELPPGASRLPLSVTIGGQAGPVGGITEAPFPLRWWEFAAATGSTLGIFALACASASSSFGPSEAAALAKAYFPSISGLHILLDYYIDQDEDRAGGDLNFVSYYTSSTERNEALLRFMSWAMDEAGRLDRAFLHQAVVRGLLAMYLSDDKVGAAGLGKEAKSLLRHAGLTAGFLRTACRVVRKCFRF